ncbi:hypothetical protein C4565_08900 [Candidatus Parcubacteria bacterium]|jgi:hypothetical protein|nr:MAG: hypothetical protein C4565_08900 [Candidatus Parcubacteria bacterium]
MFEHDYNIVGKHATYLKYMAKDKTNLSKPYIFDRYIDVFMNAAIVGFLYGRSEIKDNSSQDRARIYADAFATEKRQCDFIYRLIMLLDESDDDTQNERLDRAFRHDTQLDSEEAKSRHNNNMNLFNSYVLGGIEVLYEQFILGAANREDYINRIFDITSIFKEEIECVSYENRINELVCNS